MMKVSRIISGFSLFFLAGLLALNSFADDSVFQTKKVLSDGTVVINTTKIGASFEGYTGSTPVEIFLKDDKVVDVKPLPNSESPGYFRTVIRSGLFKKWNGLTPKEALEVEVDAVTGATFSSEAVIANVKAGLKYASDNK